jgi:hypothetical protein
VSVAAFAAETDAAALRLLGGNNLDEIRTRVTEVDRLTRLRVATMDVAHRPGLGTALRAGGTAGVVTLPEAVEINHTGLLAEPPNSRGLLGQ